MERRVVITGLGTISPVGNTVTDFWNSLIEGKSGLNFIQGFDDVDLPATEDEFLKWYDYCLEAAEFGLTTPNYKSWVKGCPRTSKESFDNLRAIKHNLERAIEIEKNLRNGNYF